MQCVNLRFKHDWAIIGSVVTKLGGESGLPGILLFICLSLYISVAEQIFTDVMDGMSSADTAFKLFDKDRDGYITRAEFAKVA